MSLKVHFRKTNALRVACRRFNAVQRTTFWKRVSCGNCKRTGAFKIAEAFWRYKNENK